MIETLKEFTFEAAHQLPPFSGLHGHSFMVQVFMRGPADPVFGWSHNLYEVEKSIDKVRLRVDHTYLNDIPGLENPSLENVAKWLWQALGQEIQGLDRIVVRRGPDGQAEGCTYSEPARAGEAQLVA